MSMVLVEIAVVNILLLIAILCEHKSGEIPPVIGWIGCAAGIACSVVGGAICSWQEALIAYAISYIIIMVIYSKLGEAIGGGTLKMAAMTATFFGRHTLFVLMVFMACIGICVFRAKRGTLNGKMLAVPFVLLGALVTSGLVYFVF